MNRQTGRKKSCHPELVSGSIQHCRLGKFFELLRRNTVSPRKDMDRVSFYSRLIPCLSSAKAFTLAEVLITLGIIGVVAALTIPNLIAQQQEKATITALKKAYSSLSQAYTLAVQENGTPDNWGITAFTKDPIPLSMLVPYLKITQNCIGVANCMPVVDVKDLNGINTHYTDYYNSRPSVKMIDGTIVTAIYAHSASCAKPVGTSLALSNACSSIAVDINGMKKPNQLGVDVFMFWMTKYGIIPIGTQQDTALPFSTYCADKTSTTAENGDACAAWVIYNENMDYTKCSGLSWNGPAKCP